MKNAWKLVGVLLLLVSLEAAAPVLSRAEGPASGTVAAGGGPFFATQRRRHMEDFLRTLRAPETGRR